jgi:hypothetical protein
MDKSYLECKFCQKPFDTDRRIARMLYTCGHSICSTCLEAHLRTHVFIVCPEDQIRISLEDVTIDRFPPNAAVIHILNSNKMNERTAQPQSRVRLPNVSPLGAMQLGSSPKLGSKNELHTVIHDLETKTTRSDRMSLSNKNKVDPKLHFSDTQSYYKRRTSEVGYDSPRSKGSIQLQVNSQDICSQHGKPIEAVCVNRECGVRVCLECGIFGDHKVS